MMSIKTREKVKFCIEKHWNLKNLDKEVIAICYHAQRVMGGYELYFTGHDDYYEEHDTWLLDPIYQPENNFYELGYESLDLTDKDLFEILKCEVKEYLSKNLSKFPGSVKYFNVCYPFGQPELIRKR